MNRHWIGRAEFSRQACCATLRVRQDSAVQAAVGVDLGKPTSIAGARLCSRFAIVAMIVALVAGPAVTAPPIVERTVPAPVTAVSREALERLPQGRDLRSILDYHNQLRAEFGSPPLTWNSQLAANADAYARVLATTGQPQHASRVGRSTERENISLSPRGTYPPLALVGRWGNERRYFRGGIFPDACTADWSQCAHFTQMVWSGTTDIGCAFHQGPQFDALVCRYSPPGNQDGRPVIARSPVININNPGGGPILQNPPGEGEAQDGGEAQNGGANDAGETRERPRDAPSVPVEDEALGTTIGDCGVGVLAKVFIVTGTDNAGRTRLKETNNLANGFSEVVIPFDFNARGEFKPSPDPTHPYTGKMRASWGIVDAPNPYTGTVAGDRAKLALGKWDDTDGNVTITAGGARPSVQDHKIEATWDPDPDTVPPQCTKEHLFTVTFAGFIPAPPVLDLSVFVGAARDAGFGGTRARAPVTDGTRVFTGTQPRSRTTQKRDADGDPVKDRQGRPVTVTNVVVPIGIYWDGQENCCDIKGAKRKVIQFARAAIHGPNGRMGKGWGLDILPQEFGDAPNHDPTYTGSPNSDGNDEVTAGGSGGTATVGNDVIQWDAPGMPKDLFDRLHAAQGPSDYRQQFLSLLVCRRGTGHQAGFYLGKDRQNRDRALICQIAITTVHWHFPGQRGVRRAENYNPPTITVTLNVRDGNCIDLRAFLTANGLLDAFTNPGADARALEILPPDRYQELDNSVTNWEANPFAGVRFP